MATPLASAAARNRPASRCGAMMAASPPEVIRYVLSPRPGVTKISSSMGSPCTACLWTGGLATAVGSASDVPNGAPYALGCERDVDVADAEVRDRVDHGALHGRR